MACKTGDGEERFPQACIAKPSTKGWSWCGRRPPAPRNTTGCRFASTSQLAAFKNPWIVFNRALRMPGQSFGWAWDHRPCKRGPRFLKFGRDAGLSVIGSAPPFKRPGLVAVRAKASPPLRRRSGGHDPAEAGRWGRPERRRWWQWRPQRESNPCLDLESVVTRSFANTCEQ